MKTVPPRFEAGKTVVKHYQVAEWMNDCSSSFPESKGLR